MTMYMGDNPVELDVKQLMADVEASEKWEWREIYGTDWHPTVGPIWLDEQETMVPKNLIKTITETRTEVELGDRSIQVTYRFFVMINAQASHDLYEPSDFTQEEIERDNQLARLVIDGGLGICKKCGASEIELEKPCKRVGKPHE